MIDLHGYAIPSAGTSALRGTQMRANPSSWHPLLPIQFNTGALDIEMQDGDALVRG